jgi:RNA-directed DNA polymerase
MIITIDEYKKFILAKSPFEIKDGFSKIGSLSELASYLEEPVKYITYHLYIEPNDKKYIVFQIPKKNGDARTIIAPNHSLKRIQKKLNLIFQKIYQCNPKESAHGFLMKVVDSEGKSIRTRNIVSCAQRHQNKRFVLNIDLKDFFPSINFGRVRGLFLSPPFNLNETVATALAQLCTYQNGANERILPQGAPTSPILTNFICFRLDYRLSDLAKVNKSTYTRYADDITFSTTLREFPHSLASLKVMNSPEQNDLSFRRLTEFVGIAGFAINGNEVKLPLKVQSNNDLMTEIEKFCLLKGCTYRVEKEFISIQTKDRQPPFTVQLGEELTGIIESNDFKINYQKVRLQTKEFRQEVTGLTVNEFPNVQRKYIRDIRAMLHAWEKFGLKKAEIKFKQSYQKAKHPSKKARIKFKTVLRGKIEYVGMVKGKENDIYLKFSERFAVLALSKTPQIRQPNAELENIILLLKQYIDATLKDNSLNSEVIFLSEKVKYLEEKVEKTSGTIANLSKYENDIRKIIDIPEQLTSNTNQEIIAELLHPVEDIIRQLDNRYELELSNISSNISEVKSKVGFQDKKLQSIGTDLSTINKDIPEIKLETGIEARTSINYDFVKEVKLRKELINDNIDMERAKSKNDFVNYCDFADKQIENMGNFFFKNKINKIDENWFGFEKRILNIMKSEYQILWDSKSGKGNIPSEKWKEWIKEIHNNAKKIVNAERRTKFLIILAYCSPETIPETELNIRYWIYMNIKNLRDERSHRGGSTETNRKYYIDQFKSESNWDLVRESVENFTKYSYMETNE